MFAAYVVVSVLLAACVASSAAVDFAISRSSSLWRGRGTGVAAAVAGLAQRSLRGRTAAAIGVPLIGTAAAIGVVLLFVGAVAVERRRRQADCNYSWSNQECVPGPVSPVRPRRHSSRARNNSAARPTACGVTRASPAARGRQFINLCLYSDL
jgi:hypothetical protein